MNSRSVFCIAASAVLMASASCAVEKNSQSTSDSGIYSKENLVAWCIVPFDAKKRGPAERAAMLKRLGLRRVAYDWREEHVATFEDEILQYKKNGLEYFAFWNWHEDMELLIRKYGIRPQIWKTNPSPKADSQLEKVAIAAQQLIPIVRKAQELDCEFGLYNHGNWGGEPNNLVAVCEYIKQEYRADNVGIVYNFHHGHDHIKGFDNAFQMMLPYLLCVNINGMANPERIEGQTNKILTLGSGEHEQFMLQVVADSGYDGPIGILDHRNELDAEESLTMNLRGLESLVTNLK